MKEPGNSKLEIARGDVCDAFEQDIDRLFSNRECWYCKHGDFDIFTEHPTENGICRYKSTINGILVNPAIQASKKQEEETK